jgi:putative component of toxin-antitoxin plasmid stabilization module
VILELKYDYSPIYRLIAIAIGGGIVIILLGCFSQKIQQRINKTVEG